MIILLIAAKIGHSHTLYHKVTATFALRGAVSVFGQSWQRYLLQMIFLNWIFNFSIFGSVLAGLDDYLTDSCEAIGHFTVTATFALKGAVSVFNPRWRWYLYKSGVVQVKKTLLEKVISS